MEEDSVSFFPQHKTSEIFTDRRIKKININLKKRVSVLALNCIKSDFSVHLPNQKNSCTAFTTEQKAD